MGKRISIEKCNITFHAYNAENFNAALMTVNGEQKYFSSGTKQGLLNKITSYLLNL